MWEFLHSSKNTANYRGREDTEGVKRIYKNVLRRELRENKRCSGWMRLVIRILSKDSKNLLKKVKKITEISLK